jgi:hypothetical protein
MLYFYNTTYPKCGGKNYSTAQFIRHHSNSPARHSRVYVHADKFENLRFKAWRENCSQNTAGIQETTNTRELWLNSFMFIFWQTRETEL